MTDAEVLASFHDWSILARDEQVAPKGNWRVWLFLAGRGSGKTRAGAEWVRERIKQGYKRIALIAPTAGDARDVMAEGDSGMLSVSWSGDLDHKGNYIGRPIYEPSKRRLTWNNGAIATLYSAEEPDRLRGPQHDAMWCDELASWFDAQETWDMAMFGLRLGRNPQAVVTTTPRPIPLIRQLAKDSNTVVTKATTYMNRANLAAAFMSQIIQRYEGTRLGRQELLAEILEESDQSLWNRTMIERARLHYNQPPFRRIVVGVDPATTAKQESNLTGIVACALGIDGLGYVLADQSGRYSPDGWARKAVELYKNLKADRIVAEGNQGGEMVRHTIHSILPNAPVYIVHASRGKQARAEPIAALYEQNKIRHVSVFPELEDQMCVDGNTLVATSEGQIAIKYVCVGDQVLTRSGYAPVKWVGQTVTKPTLKVKTSLGFHVRLSYNHPVYVTGRGFVRADELRIGDGVIEWHENPKTTASYLKGKNTIAAKAATIAQAARVVENYYTSLFGKVVEGLSQMSMKFITSILIPQITRLAISNVSQEKNIQEGIHREAHLHYQRQSEAKCARRNGERKARDLFAAHSAATTSLQQGKGQNSAAHLVGRNSTIVAIETQGSIPLWDVTVDGPPEFFANGILVHNCTWEPLGDMPSPDRLDALVWALTALMLGVQESASSATYRMTG